MMMVGWTAPGDPAEGLAAEVAWVRTRLDA